ncbi:hypothetical protein JTE90_005990 [Oedothorax gibbosus]|uniref:Polynucleotide 5'-hydroxyl-kinase NOL9 n=1 Tax=Oedothorax gibbosus TaxID=931172 RepID=A0AAV6UW81_9ARAC|nr:hypothetical protein JTE90_005990 [Oedothorax gibbosus]
MKRVRSESTMVKRGRSSSAKRQPEQSPSDRETETQRPKKFVKRNSFQADINSAPAESSTFHDGSSAALRDAKFTSTPYGNSSFQNGASTSVIDVPNTPKGNSTLAMNGVKGSSMSKSTACYDSFTSFMHSNFLLSDDDDDNLPTVSQLAQKSPCTPAPKKQEEVSDKTIVYLTPKDHKVESSHDQIVSIPVPFTNQEIVILQHKCCLTIHGYLKVTVLAGSVSILGYIIKEGKSVHVFSTPRAGKKQIETRSSVHILSRKSLALKIKSIILPKTDIIIWDCMEHVGAASVVVLLEKCILPPPLQFLGLYLPIAVEPDLPGYCNRNKSMCSTQLDVIKVSDDAETTANQLRLLVDLKVSEPESQAVRVLIHGTRGAGKSTLLRYLIHTVLNDNHTEVYYLDTDPGQTEFSPPGCVSLTKVTKPLLEPPYCHDIDPEEMIFTGSSTPSASPDMYTKCVHKLIEKFEKKHKDAILFINTMGWVEGVGNICFEALRSAIKPTLLVDLVSPKEYPEFNIQADGEGCVLVQMPIVGHTPTPNAYGPKDKRNFALLSYFGKCQKPYLPPTYLNSIRPVCVKWDDVAISVVKKVHESKLIDAIDCSVVALCHVDDKMIVDCNKVNSKDFLKTLKKEPINKCLGFGFVRAIDELNRLLYIITPLSLDQLSKVNALIKGEIVIPDDVIFKQVRIVH